MGRAATSIAPLKSCPSCTLSSLIRSYKSSQAIYLSISPFAYVSISCSDIHVVLLYFSTAYEPSSISLFLPLSLSYLKMPRLESWALSNTLLSFCLAFGRYSSRHGKLSCVSFVNMIIYANLCLTRGEFVSVVSGP